MRETFELVLRYLFYFVTLAEPELERIAESLSSRVPLLCLLTAALGGIHYRLRRRPARHAFLVSLLPPLLLVWLYWIVALESRPAAAAGAAVILCAFFALLLRLLVVSLSRRKTRSEENGGGPPL